MMAKVACPGIENNARKIATSNPPLMTYMMFSTAAKPSETVTLYTIASKLSLKSACFQMYSISMASFAASSMSATPKVASRNGSSMSTTNSPKIAGTTDTQPHRNANPTIDEE